MVAYLRANAVLLCNLLLTVHIHLDELHLARLGLLLCQTLEHGRDCFAWPAPVGVEVDNRVCRLREELGDVRRRRHGYDLAGHGGGV